MSGSLDIQIYSDVLQKYENHLRERNLILIDAELKYENNQASRIVAKILTLLNEFILNKKCNITLFIKNNAHLNKIIPLIGTLEFGYSDILLNCSSEEKQVEIKIKENIKLSLDFINNIQKINGIDFISFS